MKEEFVRIQEGGDSCDGTVRIPGCGRGWERGRGPSTAQLLCCKAPASLRMTRYLLVRGGGRGKRAAGSSPPVAVRNDITIYWIEACGRSGRYELVGEDKRPPCHIRLEALFCVVFFQNAVLPSQQVGVCARELIPRLVACSARDAFMDQEHVRPGDGLMIKIGFSVTFGKP